MKVFLTGATGFVGREVTRRLLIEGHLPVCLALPGSEKKLEMSERVILRRGDVTEPDSLQRALQGCEAVIHLVGIIRQVPEKGVTYERLHIEATRNMLTAAREQGVQRFIQMSTNGAAREGKAAYYRSKWRAEQEVRRSGARWTIFRPSIIFGKEDNFCNKLADLIRRMPVVPVIGDGCYRIAPVAVEDVALGLVRSLNRAETEGKIYYCCGSAAYPFDELLDLIGDALGRSPVRKIHQPVSLIRPLVARLENRPDFPITLEQMTMLLEGNVCDSEPSLEELGISPRPFRETIRGYLSPSS
jgi:nucleoside-diphosphate-sugar epimerase